MSPEHEADWRAYQETGTFFYLAKLCAEQLREGPEGLEDCVAEALRARLEEFCEAQSSANAARIVGVVESKGRGGPSDFSRARSETKQRQIVGAVELDQQFEDLEGGSASLKDSFERVAEQMGSSATGIKQTFYESKRRKR